MEKFDVYDKERNSLNYTKERGQTLFENEYNMGVEIWIFNENKLLMTQRSINKSHPLEWEVPGGCSIAGESSIDTLKRETYEEISVKLNDNEFKYINTEIYKKQFVDVYISFKKININNIIIQQEEVSNIKWVSYQEFHKMVEAKQIVASVANRYNLIKEKVNNLFY